ncbi:MAG: hypothetical protein KA955_08375 [Prevotella sp.]|nr:hypothetical protein [Prevotella sp.]
MPKGKSYVYEYMINTFYDDKYIYDIDLDETGLKLNTLGGIIISGISIF